MRNNAAYLPENPIVYIIFPESIHNRASFSYICAKAQDKMKTTVSVFAAFFFISVLSVSCQGDPGDFNTTFSEIEKLMNT